MGTPIENVITGAIAAVISGNKFDMIETLIPQRLEDGKLINFKGRCIGTFESEDQVFTEEGLKAPSRMTVKFVKEVTDPVAALILADDTQDDKSVEDDEQLPKIDDAPKDKLLSKGDIKELIKKGDKKSLKKAKKTLEAQFDEDHPDYDGLKKAIKKAKKAL